MRFVNKDGFPPSYACNCGAKANLIQVIYIGQTTDQYVGISTKHSYGSLVQGQRYNIYKKDFNKKDFKR